jgi:phage shock protein E
MENAMFQRVSKAFLCLFVLFASLAAWAGEVHWIDVRSESEFAAGHVEGAINIPHTEITARIAEVTSNKDARLYLYCRSGRRSAFAADELTGLGFSDVVNVGGLADAEKKAGQLKAP